MKKENIFSDKINKPFYSLFPGLREPNQNDLDEIPQEIRSKIDKLLKITSEAVSNKLTNRDDCIDKIIEELCDTGIIDTKKIKEGIVNNESIYLKVFGQKSNISDDQIKKILSTLSKGDLINLVFYQNGILN